VIEPTATPSDTLTVEAKALAKRLGSRNAQVRDRAEQQIQEMGTAGRDVLISIMRYEEQRRKSRREQMYIHTALYAVAFVMPALLFYLNNHAFWRFSMFLCGMSGGLVGNALLAMVVTRTHTNAAYLLAKHFDDVSIVGPLAEALEYRSKAVREAATAALIRLLPRLQPNDSDLLTSEQHNSLHRTLTGNNPELVLAVLVALGKIGDSGAIPNVEKLAAGLGVAAEDERIRDMAQQTLLVLRQRVELQRAPQTLLRAASEEGGELLRAATGSRGEEANELLRATSVGNE
jgi:hypothetical protein